MTDDTPNLVTDFEWDEENLANYTKEETTIFFDWDDTLLCSSWLIDQGLDLCDIEKTVTEDMLEKCKILSDSVAEILEEAKRLGQVVIITNSTNGWVDISCRALMPDVMSVLSDIPIVYAQSLYKHKSRIPLMWKQYAVVEEMGRSLKRATGKRRNILSIGDGPAEQEAMRSLKYFYSFGLSGSTVVKSVKMMEDIDVMFLIHELCTLLPILPRLVSQDEGLDLVLNL